MELRREKIIGFIIILVAFFSITSALKAKASFWQDIFSGGENNENTNKSIFDISGLDSDEDGLSDKEEYKMGTNPYNVDSDEDGYSDAEEVKFGYNPLEKEVNDLVDADGDGLSGEDEKKYNTNPQKSDTDYDGYDDGLEIISGHDPLQADYSFLEPMATNAQSTNGNDQNKQEEDCEGGDCSNNTKESYHFDRSTPESIESILNAKTFEEIDTQTFSTIGLDVSQFDLEKEVSLPDVLDDKIIIKKDTSQEAMQDYFNIIGIILYSNSPIHSMEEAENYAGQVNIVNPIQVEEMKQIVSKMKKEFMETEVPNKEEFITLHKKILGAAITLESMFGSLKEINFNRDDAFYNVMNLLPKFSGLNDIIFDDIYPEAQRLAEENGVELPKRDFLEQYQ